MNIQESLINHFIKGSGIEIGALHNPMPIPQEATVKYVDKLSKDELKAHYTNIVIDTFVDVDILDDGETLTTIADNSQDFVIASHFLEHAKNPILTVENMLRVLKEDGILYLAIPNKNYTFDILRPITPLSHIMKDYKEGPENSIYNHYLEGAEYFGELLDEEKKESYAKKNFDTNNTMHFHVWTHFEIIEMFAAMRNELNFPFEIEISVKNGHGSGQLENFEVVVILRKTEKIDHLNKLVDMANEIRVDKDLSAEDSYSLNVKLAKGFFQLNKFEMATKLYIKATKDKPSCIETRITVAKLLLQKSDLMEALTMVGEIIKLDPNNIEIKPLMDEISRIRDTYKEGK